MSDNAEKNYIQNDEITTNRFIIDINTGTNNKLVEGIKNIFEQKLWINHEIFYLYLFVKLHF